MPALQGLVLGVQPAQLVLRPSRSVCVCVCVCAQHSLSERSLYSSLSGQGIFRHKLYNGTKLCLYRHPAALHRGFHHAPCFSQPYKSKKVKNQGFTMLPVSANLTNPKK
eukprot:1161797-Pelagomonas_calceolata.AAC.9